MKTLQIALSLLSFYSINGLEIVGLSPDVIIKKGEDATLSCEADTPFDSCTWYLPNGGKCGPLTTASTQCRVAGGVGDNILFDGSSTLCQIKIKSVKNEESGEWICSLEKDGYMVNSSSVQLIEAMPATVDWQDVYGSMEVRSEEPAPKITCTAAHSRPVGRFLWFLGEDRDVALVNDSPLEITEGDQGFVEASQDYTFIPRPELDNQNLYCVYIQEDGNGRELYNAETSIELRAHYLALADATPVVLTAESGDDVEINMMFEAQPKPIFGEINWKIRKGENSELIIPVKDDDINRIQNYEAHPLQEVEKYLYKATLIIKNVSKQENVYDHLLHMVTRIGQNSEELEFLNGFDVQVDLHALPVPKEGFNYIPIVIIIIVLILLIAVALVVYAYCTKSWCFKSNAIQETEEQTKPLQEQHKPFARP